MRIFFTERNLVVVLFVMVIAIFSMAQKDSRKMDELYYGIHATTLSNLADLSAQPAGNGFEPLNP